MIRARSIPTSQRCARCRRRYKQRDGLCRSCGRAAGLYTMTTAAAELERLERLEPATPAPIARAPRPRRTVTIDGAEYLVMFDGT